MKLKENRIIIYFLIFLLALSSLLGGYWVLNKEQINLTVKGEEIKVSTFKTTVKELLDEKNIEYNQNDKIIPSLDTKVTDYMDIKIIKVLKEQKSEYEEIPYEVKIIDTENLLKGKSETQQEGMAGKKEIIYELTYEDDKLVNKTLAEEVIREEPIDKIVKRGIKQETIVASRGEISRNKNGKQMKVVATAYAGDTITATGTVPKWGTIAVDPKIIPYGTKVYIPQFKMTFVAEDCGGAIKGNKIDIFMGSRTEAYSWGRRTIDIVIIG